MRLVISRPTACRLAISGGIVEARIKREVGRYFGDSGRHSGDGRETNSGRYA